MKKKGPKPMRLLFFDMEFADGRVPGSIYSIGYMVTDEEFHVLTPPTDLLIHPDSTWNAYVAENILAYPMELVESAPKFPEHYTFLKELFAQADFAVGFAVNNDTVALRKDCERYGLEPIAFRTVDMEKLCRRMEEHKDARGLAGCVKAWCGEEPDHQHRSDGDAYATMLLFRAICASKHATPEMMTVAYPGCCGMSLPKNNEKGKRKKTPFRKRRTAKHKKNTPSAQSSTAAET